MREVDVLAFLSQAKATVQGRFIDASNQTLLLTLEGDGVESAAVYKPAAGHRALHDFDAATLSAREVIAYELSEAWGFQCVPATVWREDLVFGPGSVQLFVEHDERDAADVIPAAEAVAEGDAPVGSGGVPDGFLVAVTGSDEDGHRVHLVHADEPGLRRIALFDVVTNNADRKAGHLLHADGRWHAIDNGLTLHPEPKLRTVLWGWAGEPLTAEEHALLATSAEVPDVSSAPVLHAVAAADELAAMAERVRLLVRAGVLPVPDAVRRSIPWPVF